MSYEEIIEITCRSINLTATNIEFLSKETVLMILKRHDKQLIKKIEEHIKPLQEYLDNVVCQNDYLKYKINGHIQGLQELKRDIERQS